MTEQNWIKPEMPKFKYELREQTFKFNQIDITVYYKWDGKFTELTGVRAGDEEITDIIEALDTIVGGDTLGKLEEKLDDFK